MQEKRLAGPASGADSRVTKFEHRLQEVFNFDRREIAIVCVLLLRGPQTPGELRSRTDRMYHFEALDDVISTLDRLAHRDPPLAAILPRQPGTKESRYTHLFSGEPPTSTLTSKCGTNVARAPSPAHRRLQTQPPTVCQRWKKKYPASARNSPKSSSNSPPSASNSNSLGSLEPRTGKTI